MTAVRAASEVQAAIACPWCASEQVEVVSEFGCQLLFSHFRCLGCRSYFEAVRDDRRDDEESISAPFRARAG